MAARDVLLVGVLLFIVGIGFFVVNFATNTAIDSLKNNTEFNSSPTSIQALSDSQDNAVNRVDWFFFGFMLAFVFGILITGWLVGSHPVFMFFYLLIIIVGVVLSAVFANVWETITQASVFGSTISHMPIANHVLTNLPLYLAGLGIVGIMVMFAKPFFKNDYG